MREFIKKNNKFGLALFIMFAVRSTFADHYRIPSESMYPNLHIGDHIGVNKAAYDLKIPFTDFILAKVSEPERGDVVVFLWPGDNKTNYVKRLIALPGDRVQVVDGFISVNGSEMRKIEPAPNVDTQIYIESLSRKEYTVQRTPRIARRENIEFRVPENSYFFMGDNRDNSADSRLWGFVKRYALKGKAGLVLWNARFDSIAPKFDFTRILKPLG